MFFLKFDLLTNSSTASFIYFMKVEKQILSFCFVGKRKHKRDTCSSIQKLLQFRNKTPITGMFYCVKRVVHIVSNIRIGMEANEEKNHEKEVNVIYI